MISSSFNFIFLHLPKTGGSSIHSALIQYSDDRIVVNNELEDGVELFDVRNKQFPTLDKHSTLDQYYQLLGKTVFAFKIFIIIRNPFDRVVSYYFSPHRGEVKWNFDAFKEHTLTQVDSVSRMLYVKRRFSVIPRIMTDRVKFLRFENIEDEFANMCSEVGLPKIDLPHRNKSPNRLDYRDCFSEELRRKVERKFALEMKIGNYTF